MEASTGRSSNLGEQFTFYSDSGGECLLIKESVALRFSGERTTDIVIMRGIGNICIKRINIVCINGFILEINFHVLADSY